MRATKDSDATVRSKPLARPASQHRPFRRFLRDDSAWTWRAWVFFGCALVFATIQANPSWTHPSLLLDWPLPTCFALVGVAGAVTGLVAARYRFAGLVAGVVAGIGSLFGAMILFQGFDHFPRVPVVIVEMIGLLPGLALYYVLHTAIDLFQSNH
jgi:hypothetical protein